MTCAAEAQGRPAVTVAPDLGAQLAALREQQAQLAEQLEALETAL